MEPSERPGTGLTNQPVWCPVFKLSLFYGKQSRAHNPERSSCGGQSPWISGFPRDHPCDRPGLVASGLIPPPAGPHSGDYNLPAQVHRLFSLKANIGRAMAAHDPAHEHGGVSHTRLQPHACGWPFGGLKFAGVAV